MSIWDRVDTPQKKQGIYLPITEVYATTRGIYVEVSRDHARTFLYHLFEILILNLRANLDLDSDLQSSGNRSFSKYQLSLTSLVQETEQTGMQACGH